MRELMRQYRIDRNPALWHQLRSTGITGSRIASIMGIPGAFGTPLSVYLAMTEGDSIPDNDRLALGRHLEPFVAARFAARHPGLAVIPAGLYAADDLSWHLGTFDRFTFAVPDGSRRPDSNKSRRRIAAGRVESLQIKTVFSFRPTDDMPWNVWGDEPDGEIPAAITAQCLWENAIIGEAGGWLAAMNKSTGQVRVYRVPWDAAAAADVAAMRKAAADHLARVEERDPPAATWRPAETAALKRIFAKGEDRAVEVPDELADRAAAAKAARKLADQACVQAENELRLLMGNALRAVRADGRTVATRSLYQHRETQLRDYPVDRLNIRARP